MKKTVTLLLLLMMGGAGVLAPQDPAQQAPQTAPQTPAQTAPPVPVGNLSLTDASLAQVVDQLMRQLQLNYVVDADIQGSVTLNTYGNPVNLDARNLLELLLRINGLGMVQEGDLYRIVPLNQMRRLPIANTDTPADIPEDDRMMLNLVFLKYITVDTLSTLLGEFTDERTIIRSYAPANLLMILDSRRNMKRLMELVAMFDSDTFAGQRVRLFKIDNLLPSELQKELEQVLQALSLDGESKAVRFLAVDRIGLLIAVAPNPGVFDTVAEWIKKLDIPITTTSGIIDTYVYRVRYGRADCLAIALNQLYNPYSTMGGGYGYGGGAGIVGGGYAASPYQNFGGGYGPYGGWAGAGGGYNVGYGGGSQSGYGSGNSFNSSFGGSGGCGPYSALGGGYGGGYGGGGYGGYGVPSFGGYAAQVPVNTAQGGLIGASATTQTQANGQPGSTLNGQNGQNGPTPPRIVPNPLDNALLIQATKEQYQGILKLLRELDRPPRQILLQAKIYSLSLNNSLSSGIQAKLAPISGNERRLTGVFNGTLGLNAGLLVGQSRELMVAVAAQEGAGNARIISEPSLIATDSIPATINVGTQVPVLTGQTATPVQVNGSNAFTQGISSHNTGVTLQVNARVNPSGVVTLIINQEVSKPTATTQQNSGSNLPTPSFDQQVVQTQITLQDGDTIAIGGTITDNTSSASLGIPGLSRIPGLGALFGSRTYNRDRSELIIFMTPHVIYDTTDLLEASEELKSAMRRLQRYIP